MFKEAPESTIQLWTFRLNISNFSRKGGVVDLELLPISVSLSATVLMLSLKPAATLLVEGSKLFTVGTEG